MPSNSHPTVLVIGAGLAGLACARRLLERGISCVVLDRGRSVGGRVNTRTIELDGRTVTFDHGAPTLHARTGAFCEAFDAWIRTGLAEDASSMALGSGSSVRAIRAPGGMRALPSQLSAGLDIRPSCQAQRIEADGSRWVMRYQHYEAQAPENLWSRAVVFACPAPQAARVLGASGLCPPDEFSDIQYTPTWVCMMVLAPGLAQVHTHTILRCEPSGPIDSVSLEPADGWGTSIVVRMSSSWSMKHGVGASPDEIEPLIIEHTLGILSDRFGTPVGTERVVHASVHRWGLASAQTTLNLPHLLDREQMIGYAGDYFAGTDGVWRDAEGAYLSGRSLGEQLANLIDEPI